MPTPRWPAPRTGCAAGSITTATPLCRSNAAASSAPMIRAPTRRRSGPRPRWFTGCGARPPRYWDCPRRGCAAWRSMSAAALAARGMCTPKTLLVTFLARKLGRPVRWIEGRSEHLMSATHSRDQLHDLEVGFDDEGHILALRDDYIVDCGAWNPIGSGVAYNTAVHLTGLTRSRIWRPREGSSSPTRSRMPLIAAPGA